MLNMIKLMQVVLWNGQMRGNEMCQRGSVQEMKVDDKMIGELENIVTEMNANWLRLQY